MRHVVPRIVEFLVVTLLAFLAIQWSLFRRIPTAPPADDDPRFVGRGAIPPRNARSEHSQSHDNMSVSSGFPKWPSSGIHIQDLMHFLSAHLLRSPTPHFPVLLYVLKRRRHREDFDTSTHFDLWTCRAVREKHISKDRIQPVESLFERALQHLATSRKQQWQALRRALENDAGVPFVVDYMDYTGCGGHTHAEARTNTSSTPSMLPVFTMCATLQPFCDYAFPIPTYFMISTAQSSWKETRQHDPPFVSKQRQAVWRGAFTGQSWDHGRTNQRREMYRLSKQDNNAHFINAEEARRGGEHYMPMDQYRNFRAILDLDGDAWSKRFVALLCFNSVVLKVEPKYVDYFHPNLQPWIHYIPVNGHLSDLVDQVKFAVSDEHQEEVQQIIRHAQQWCAQHVTEQALVEDMLDIWNKYVELLNQGDPTWQEIWRETNEAVLSTPAYDMVRLRRNGTIRYSSGAAAVDWPKVRMETS